MGTANYNLKQWGAWEVPGRAALNGTLEAVDAALSVLAAGKLEAVFGSYTGDNTVRRLIYLGFQPRAVILVLRSGLPLDAEFPEYHCAGIFFPGMVFDTFEIAEQGFYVGHPEDQGWHSSNSDHPGMSPYHYIAFH